MVDYEQGSYRPEQEAPVSPPPRRRSRVGFWIATVLALLFFLSSVVLFLILVVTVVTLEVSASRGAGLLKYQEEVIDGTGEQKILLLPVECIITCSQKSSLFVTIESTVVEVHDKLKKAASDPLVAGIVLYINSPGGGITASDTVHHEIARFREDTKKPVVAFLGDIAASGGYYIAASADYIVAHPTTVTGSIGVMLLHV